MSLKKYLSEVSNVTELYEKVLDEKKLNLLVHGDVNLDLTYEMYLKKFENSLKIRLLEMLLKDVLNDRGYGNSLNDLSLSDFLTILDNDNSKLEADLDDLETLIRMYNVNLNS